MRLDARLAAIAEFADAGCKAADIGADHGYLSAYLVKTQKAKFVIATEKNVGPYRATLGTVADENLADKISVRLGDGLSALKAGEVDTIIIAGMGGALMADILAARRDVWHGAETLILQPMNAAKELRRMLYENSWHITDEALAKDKHIYEIIKAKKGKRDMPSDFLLAVGPIVFAKKPPLFFAHAQAIREKLKRRLRGMEKSEAAKKSAAYQKTAAELADLEKGLQ